jgi:hypothetical protein
MAFDYGLPPADYFLPGPKDQVFCAVIKITEIAKIELTNILSQCNFHGLSLSCIASDGSYFSGNN